MKFIQADYTLYHRYYFKVPPEVNLEADNVDYGTKWRNLYITVYDSKDKKNIIKEYTIEPSNEDEEFDYMYKWADDEQVVDSNDNDDLEEYMTKEELQNEEQNKNNIKRFLEDDDCTFCVIR